MIKSDLVFGYQEEKDAGQKTERRGGSHMAHSQNALASRANIEYSVNEGLVARRLDQLEDIGRYSVIYEIARIETILAHAVIENHCTPQREMIRVLAIC